MTAARVFFDTNVLLYLLSEDDAKADRAEALLASGGVVSVQVLNEFASVASRKLRLSWTEIHEVLETVRQLCRVDPLLVATHDRALEISDRCGLTIYESLIVASALGAECDHLLTEDLQGGRRIDDRLLVKNPFSTER